MDEPEFSEVVRRFRRRATSGPVTKAQRAEAQQLGEMIEDLFKGIAGTRIEKRVQRIRAGATVEETRRNQTKVNTPSLFCPKCLEIIQADTLAAAYSTHGCRRPST